MVVVGRCLAAIAARRPCLYQTRIVMSVSLLTNLSATAATNHLSSVSMNLQQSLNRLSSGKKIVNPADDAGGLAVSMKMSAAIKRQAAASDNLANAMSYLQTQDGALDSANKILSRIGELKTMAQDVTKNDTDKANYDTEFQSLQDQLRGLASETFNGISLFSGQSLSVRTSIDESNTSVELTSVDLLGANLAPFSPVSSSFDNLDGFTDQSQNTATASSSSGKLALATNSNDLAQVDTETDVSGAWELTYNFSKSTVADDDLTLFLGGSEVFRYDASDPSNHSVRISFDGVDTAEVFMDGSSIATETNTVGASSGKLRLQLSSTVSGATAYIDNFSLASNVSSNDTGSVATASDLASIDISTVTDAIQEVATFRAQNGAQQSRLQFAKDQLTVNQANLEAANSRIVDVDVAVESTRLARFNILQQAGASMLSQANQSQQIALKLIG